MNIIHWDKNSESRTFSKFALYLDPAVDGSLILGIYLFVSFLWRDIFWLRKMNGQHWYTAFIAGMAIAAVIEYRRVFITMTWRYNQFMPTIFGIGLSPLFQLSITGGNNFLVNAKNI